MAAWLHPAMDNSCLQQQQQLVATQQMEVCHTWGAFLFLTQASGQEQLVTLVLNQRLGVWRVTVYE
jgi:hypothetical protein